MERFDLIIYTYIQPIHLYLYKYKDSCRKDISCMKQSLLGEFQILNVQILKVLCYFHDYNLRNLLELQQLKSTDILIHVKN